MIQKFEFEELPLKGSYKITPFWQQMKEADF